jgi:hypothetical protein
MHKRMFLRRIAAYVALGTPLLLPWTTGDSTGGSLGPYTVGRQANGLQQLPVIILNLVLSPIDFGPWALLLYAGELVVIGSWIGLLIAVVYWGRGSTGTTWDVLLAGAAYGLLLTWLWVFALYSIGRNITIQYVAFGYTHLLLGFWLVPVAILVAAGIRFLPDLLFRGPEDRKNPSSGGAETGRME